MNKIIVLFFLVLLLFSFSLCLFSNEKDNPSSDNNLLNKKMHSLTFMNEKLFSPDILLYKTSKKPPLKKSIPSQKNKPKTNIKVKATKGKLTNKQKAAIAVNVSGAGFLLAGVGLLAASFVYSDYIEKNETVYEKYVEGKNLSRGLFYGSTAGLGTGAICLSVSIPLFLVKKSKSVKNNKNKSSEIKKIKNKKDKLKEPKQSKAKKKKKRSEVYRGEK